MDVHKLGRPKRLPQTAALGEHHTVDPATGLKPFKLPDLLDSRVKAYKFVKQESPWKRYEKIRELPLGTGDPTTLAQQRGPTFDVVSVRSFRGHDAKEKLRALQRIQHDNFVSVLEVFSFEGAFHIIFERIPISLRHFARIPYYLDELQLASIVGQILNGLTYLASKGLEHGSLSCANILVNSGGDVKLANQEYCRSRPLGKAEPRDVRALRYITMELMQKHVKDNGAVGVDDLHRWPPDSNAVGFLGETTSAPSVDVLMKHPLLNLPWRKERLKAMVSMAQEDPFFSRDFSLAS